MQPLTRLPGIDLTNVPRPVPLPCEAWLKRLPLSARAAIHEADHLHGSPSEKGRRAHQHAQSFSNHGRRLLYEGGVQLRYKHHQLPPCNHQRNRPALAVAGQKIGNAARHDQDLTSKDIHVLLKLGLGIIITNPYPATKSSSMRGTSSLFHATSTSSSSLKESSPPTLATNYYYA